MKNPCWTIIQQHRINKWRTTHTPHAGQIHIVTTDKHITQLSPKLQMFILLLFGTRKSVS